MRKFLKVSGQILFGLLAVIFFGAFEGDSQTVRNATDAVLSLTTESWTYI
jgi:intracellular septation protein A